MIKTFIVEDDRMTSALMERKLSSFDKIEISSFDKGEDFIKALSQNPEIVIIDYNLPDMNGIEIMKKVRTYNNAIKIVVFSGQEEVEVVVDCYKNGADHYVVKNENCWVELTNAVKNLCSTVSLRKEVEELRSQVIDRNSFSNIIGNSPKILKVLKMVEKVKDKNLLVMVTGESGTGKELVARAIHYNSVRKKESFVPVNIAAIPEDLIESELFGHEKGAFTGASGRRIGKFEQAHKGTIFLDEIGEIDMLTQTKLLRVLQEQEVQRIGSNKTISLDTRVVAATNKHLAEEVKKGNFREDLYYRLQGFLIELPPLRDRGNDIMLLARSFVEQYSKQNKLDIKLDKETLKVIADYDWPGNVRELKNVMERACLMADGKTITPEDLMLIAA